MKCQHGFCQNNVTKVPIICIMTKNPEVGLHVTFAPLMGCDKHTQGITVEDLLDAGAWPLIRRECDRNHLFPDAKGLSLHLASVDRVIKDLQAEGQ